MAIALALTASRIGFQIAVAIDFDIGEQTHEALFGKALKAA